MSRGGHDDRHSGDRGALKVTTPAPTRYLQRSYERRSGEIERLLEAHRINFRLPPGDKRVSLDLIKTIIAVEQRHVGIATVRTRDAQLPAIDSADAMRNVEFDGATSSHGVGEVGCARLIHIN